MSDQNNVDGKLRKEPNRKEPRQINFRVSESEYLKLERSAKTLNMSVPTFVKKKAQGARLVTPKLDKETRDLASKNIVGAANNINTIAKYCNTHKDGNVNWERLNTNVEKMSEELHAIWQQLN